MSIIVVDCGHMPKGYSDRGARCADGRMENDLNIEVTNKLLTELSRYHTCYGVGNDGSDVVSRGKRGAELNCDLMLSIHHNAYGQGANGTTVIKSVYADKLLPKVASTAKAIQDNIVAALGTRSRNGGEPVIRWNSAQNADYYGVIRGNGKHNTLIIEALFCDNPDDLKKWDPDKIVDAVARAVYTYFGGGESKPTVNPPESENEPLSLTVGSEVNFSGGSHYASSDAAAATGGNRSAGRARLSIVKNGAKHPYHLVGLTSNVYGWVDSSTVTPVSADTAEGEYLAGDADGDGELGLTDALLVLRAAAKLASLSGKAFTAADMDGNGEVTVADALSILKQIVDSK